MPQVQAAGERPSGGRQQRLGFDGLRSPLPQLGGQQFQAGAGNHPEPESHDQQPQDQPHRRAPAGAL